VSQLLPPNPRFTKSSVQRRWGSIVSVVSILYNSNGKPYVDFKHETGTIFTVWLSREFFRAFRGLIPEGYEAYHLDGNRSNLDPTNLDVRPRSKAKSKFRLATIPRGGLPPAA